MYEIPTMINRLISPIIIKVINFIEYDVKQLKVLTGEKNQNQTKNNSQKILRGGKKTKKSIKKSRKNKTYKRTK